MDPEVTRYMIWNTHRTIDDARSFLSSCEARWQSGAEYFWVITECPKDEAIGGISYRLKGDSADFGYVLNRNHWRRGIATEAVRAVVSWICSMESIRRVWATCDVENIASARVLEKAGFIREDVLPASTVRPNISSEPRDTYLYARGRNAA
jgi:RimJ/RimL family protein N-acetyltransferase